MADSFIQQYPPNDTDTMPLTATTWPWTVRDSRMDLAFPPTARLVFRAIAARCSYEKGKWFSFPSHDLIHRDTEVAVRYVKRMVKLLATGYPKKGIEPLLLIKHRYDEHGQQISNEYILPAERMWQAAKATIAAEKKISEDKRKEREAKVDAFLKAGVAPVDLDDQADVVDLADSAATFTEADDEDIATINAKADAACVAATGGNCLMVAQPAAPSPVAKTDGKTASDKDVEGFENFKVHARNLYKELGRVDVPEDLMPAYKLASPLHDREGDDTWGRVLAFALADEFWKANMKKSSKKLYDGCPIRYFVKNFDSIRAQADEKTTKSAKKAPAKAASKKSWNQADWQRTGG